MWTREQRRVVALDARVERHEEREHAQRSRTRSGGAATGGPGCARSTLRTPYRHTSRAATAGSQTSGSNDQPKRNGRGSGAGGTPPPWASATPGSETRRAATAGNARGEERATDGEAVPDHGGIVAGFGPSRPTGHPAPGDGPFGPRARSGSGMMRPSGAPSRVARVLGRRALFADPVALTARRQRSRNPMSMPPRSRTGSGALVAGLIICRSSSRWRRPARRHRARPRPASGTASSPSTTRAGSPTAPRARRTCTTSCSTSRS